MSLFKKVSSPFLVTFLLATTLPTSCTLPGAETSLTAQTFDGKAAVSGIVSRGRSSDGRFVPPETPVEITVTEINNSNNIVAQGKTDTQGRFYISNIPANKTGTRYTINIENTTFTQKEELLFAGQVKDLAKVDYLNNTVNELESEISIRRSGVILNPTEEPVVGLNVRDKNRTYTSVTTNGEGEFELSVTGKEIEVQSPNNPEVWLSFDVEQLDRNNGQVILDFNNVRTIQGNIKDISNSQVPIANALVKIAGQSVSTRSDRDGNYRLNGAPRSAITLEVTPPEEYSKATVQIPPASDEETFVQNIKLRGIGTLQVNFTAESVKGFSRVEDCNVAYNCRRFDISPPFSEAGGEDLSEPYYHNRLGILEPITATVRIEGTDLSQTVVYPPAPLVTLKGTDRLGEVVTLDEATTAANQVISVSFDNVPGGAQSVTISLTGHQTQKSIPVYIPPKDTISTELITLYRVKPVSAVGDVQGFVRSNGPLSDNIRIAFIDTNDSLGIYPSAGETISSNLFPLLKERLSKNSTSVNPNSGYYYLKNVPTGSRIMLVAASVSETGELTDCYIPNASVLLNVRAGQINLAPDLTLTKRPNECN